MRSASKGGRDSGVARWPPEIEDIDEQFDRIDLDRDGVISRDEFVAWLRRS